MSLNFASDNVGPVAPGILEAIVKANGQDAMPYGNDAWTKQAQDQIRALFDMPEAEVLLVSVGTAANALALAGHAAPWSTIYCHRVAHIEEDECGAPEFFTGGAKLTLIDGADGKITPDGLRAALKGPAGKSVHQVQQSALSLTNVTEVGTVYSLEELAALTEIAHTVGLSTHLDGARFANACATLGCTAAEMARGFDVISFGGTKNGCMGVEAIIIRDPSRGWEAELRRKRAGHLWSKHRFLGAQMAAYTSDELWLELAHQANASAQALAENLQSVPGAEFVHPPHANMIFLRLPRVAHARALKGGAEYYVMEGDVTQGAPNEPLLCRLVCDWSKTQSDVDALVALLHGS